MAWTSVAGAAVCALAGTARGGDFGDAAVCGLSTRPAGAGARHQRAGRGGHPDPDKAGRRRHAG
ncbi:MAG TPA: hypothetical protein VEQ11_04255 [Chloroflexota bacterium]|nr:hypothetical protein [Chloroflexota bacterium]